ncbi:MAG TPA: phage tail sheath subtilisin-like domain-containing protein [Allosphingosinicella sp.]|nr:phage tail sheath subtilisin-like domain-containing protein [Allosphingosinicella sp.]
MPEYLAPGVFVEETSFRAKSIEGVGTSTAAFVGLTSRGPVSREPSDPTPPMLTSFGDFERFYGSLDPLRIGNAAVPNHLALAAQAFFANGGGRLYVARITGAGAAAATTGNLASSGGQTKRVIVQARYPGGGSVDGTDTQYVVTVTESALPTTKRLALKQPAGTMVQLVNGYYVVGVEPMPTSLETVAAFTALADDGALSIVTVSVEVRDASGIVYEAAGLGLHPRHPRYIGTVMGARPPKSIDRLTNPVLIELGDAVTAFELRTLLTEDPLLLKNGADGAAPTVDPYNDALASLLALEDISIIAAPGSSTFAAAAAINQALIGSAEARRAYRIAVLDTPPDQEPNDVRALKNLIDSKYAALYYPWIRVANPMAATDPLQPGEIDVPPSGAVCGIYARSDVQRGVWKAPANETVTGALDLQRDVRFGEQEGLNPLGINCIRKLPNRGIRVWGARTLSSDPEWKYVNIRRYFIYLEASIDRGTQWAVFEPNGEALWANVRTTVSDFLYNEWMNGALLGATPKEAFFVRCDRSTMTQNDLDNGRLVCQVGVAAIKPAEFVIFKIGQKTADARG